MTKVYGIDLDQEITPLMVRDAIVECFQQAHCADAGISLEDEDVNRSYCQKIVKRAFNEAEADFENPTREGIMKVLEKLKKFAKSFRDPSIIKKHYQEIMELVEKLK
ncbi:hypothetical protein K8R66_03445 [bacterium]|nr:hypothetical protein [bacterium]